jgi:outer membrane protein
MLNRMKKIIIIISFCFAAVGATVAQGNTTLSYSVGFPVGDLSDFISKMSWRGVTLDYRKMINPNIGVGFSAGWNVFYEAKDRATYTIDNQSLTGKQFRYSNHIPLYINPTYYLKPGATVNPFFSLGIGTIYTLRNTDMNLYTLEQESWGFALAPEVGLQYGLGEGTGAAFSVSGRLNYAFKSGDIKSDQSFFTLNIGFTFMN